MAAMSARSIIARWAHRATTILALALLTAAPAAAQRTLVIERFDATIEVSADGSLRVEEYIVPRFTGTWNGIFRTIPVEYRSPQGLNYTLRLDIQSVTDDEGRSLKYESSRERHYRKLKIWVPGATNTTRIVKVVYRVSNGLRFFDEHDELYWNVTGDEWEVPIESASAQVTLPAGVSGVRATAFRGAYGSTEQSDVTIEDNRVNVKTTRGLGMREGLTVVVGWNPGVVHRPTSIERTADAVYSNMPLAHSSAGLSWHVSTVAATRARSRTVADHYQYRAAGEHDAGGARHVDRRQAGHAGHHVDHRGPRRPRLRAHHRNEG